MFVIRRGMFLLSLTATCQVYTVSLKAGLYTYNRLAPRTLNAPDGHPTQAYTHIMGVTCQAPAPITGGFMLQLEAEGQKEGEDALEKRLAIAEEVAVGGFVSKIDSDGTVVAGPFGCCAHVSPLSSGLVR